MPFFVGQTRNYLPDSLLVEPDSSTGTILSVCGPVVVAIGLNAAVHEIVHVGGSLIVGEVIGMQEATTTIQIFEDSAGCQVGDIVTGTKAPLSVELAPGIMSNVYDGLQRPLHDMEKYSNSIYIPKGKVEGETQCKWKFLPNPPLSVGSYVIEGDIIGTVQETKLFEHRLMLPPHCAGYITKIAEEGEYPSKSIIYAIRQEKGEIREFSMQLSWPVRTPRPVAEKIPADVPLITGQRVLDGIFPCPKGGTAALPVHCGKSVIHYAISKHSNSDFHVAVHCSERATQNAELLMDFPEILVEKNGNESGIMEQSILVANTSNMPVAAREASIYTGITLAEYIRDMGYDVTLLADSISRWVESVKEISISLGETPTEFGYPSYLVSRLEDFFGRAGKVACLGSPERVGSISIFATLAPLCRDRDPVTSAVLNIVDTFWALDVKLARQKHFPSVNWTCSFSKATSALTDYKHTIKSEWMSLRSKTLEILRYEADLEPKRVDFGYNSLAEDEKLIFYTARIIRESFLQQNIFTEYDTYCPLYKTIGMLRNIVCFHELASKVVKASGESVSSITANATEVIQQLQDMKFLSPASGELKIQAHLQEINLRVREKLERR